MEFDRSQEYSDEDIERAMATVARVIELYGDTYWPILERLESELDQRRLRSSRLNKHLKRHRQFKSIRTGLQKHSAGSSVCQSASTKNVRIEGMGDLQ